MSPMENNISETLSFEEYRDILSKIRAAEQGDEKLISASLISFAAGKEFSETQKELLFISENSPFRISERGKKILSELVFEFCEKKIPYQYLTGEADFFGRSFYVGENTLIPRNDTEILVEKTLELVSENSRILDLCCGSGCIGITVSAESGAEVLLADFSESALAVTEKNIKKFGLEKKCKTVRHDIRKDTLAGSFDIIVSNPPYIPENDIETLSEYVRKEPVSALDGGGDGLDFYRIIVKKYLPRLVSGGYFLFECGIGQSEDVSHILKVCGMKNIGVSKDYGGVERIVWGRKYE